MQTTSSEIRYRLSPLFAPFDEWNDPHAYEIMRNLIWASACVAELATGIPGLGVVLGQGRDAAAQSPNEVREEPRHAGDAFQPPWTLCNQTLCDRAVAGQAAGWRSREGDKSSVCSSHHAIEEVAKHSGDRAALSQAHRRRRMCASSHRKPCHWNLLRSLSPLGQPHPLLGLQRRLASARRCSRRYVDGTVFDAGRSASCRV